MSDQLLYNQSQALLVLLFFAMLLLAGEVGFLIGRRARSKTDDTTKAQIGTIQAAILGLLAVSRFDARKQLVVDEANAIGTAFLRAQMLSQPRREEVADLFRNYVDARLEASGAGLDQDSIQALEERAGQIQEKLWANTMSEAQQDPRAVTTGLFVESLNEVIDVKSKRNAALNNHVPESVLLLLAVVAVIAVVFVGYGCGLGNRRMIGAQVALSTFIALVVLVIVDLDRPRRGLIRVSQQSMTELKESLSKMSR